MVFFIKRSNINQPEIDLKIILIIYSYHVSCKEIIDIFGNGWRKVCVIMISEPAVVSAYNIQK
jgi:hypothetical protein